MPSSRVNFDEASFPLLDARLARLGPLQPAPPAPDDDDAREVQWFDVAPHDDQQDNTGHRAPPDSSMDDGHSVRSGYGDEDSSPGDSIEDAASATLRGGSAPDTALPQVRRSSRLRTSLQPRATYLPRIGGRETAADLTQNIPAPAGNPFVDGAHQTVDTPDAETEVASDVGGCDTDVDTAGVVDPLQLAMSVVAQVRGSVEEELVSQMEELRAADEAVSNEPTSAPQTQRELDALPPDERKEWRMQDDAEMGKLEANKTFGDSADLGTKPFLPMHLVRKVKRTKVKKSRGVVGGHLQKEGTHFDLHSSPAASWTGVRTSLALIAMLCLSAMLIDFESAYTQSVLPVAERVWLRMPKPYRTYRKDSSGRMIEQLRLLIRSLYGLKQAGLLWNKLLNEFLTGFGFKRCFADYCIYILVRGTATLLICLYVDDMLIGHSDAALLASFLDALHASGLKFNTLPDLSDFLGAQVLLAPGRTFLYLEQYLLGLEERYHADLITVEQAEAQGTSPYVCTPDAPCSTKLREMVDAATAAGTTPSDDPALVRLMQAILGCTGYAVHVCRVDGAYTHGLLSRVATRATDTFYFAALCFLRYLVRSARRGILYSADLSSIGGIFPSTDQVIPYTLTDASWGLRRSISGVLIFLCGGLIRYGAKTQASIALSTVEAEYMALSIACCHLLFVLHLLEDLGFKVPRPLLIKTDSEGARKLSRNMSNTGLAMHIERRYLRIREIQSEGTVRVDHLKGLLNLSDICTKYDPVLFGPYRDAILPLVDDVGIGM